MPIIDKIAKGALKLLAKEAPAARRLLPTADLLLPASEREANLSKFLEDSKVKETLYRGQRRAPKSDKFVTTQGRAVPSFTTDPEVGNVYSRQLETGKHGSGSTSVPVHVQMTNPLDIRDLGEHVIMDEFINRLSHDLNAPYGSRAMGYYDLADMLEDLDKTVYKTNAQYDIDASSGLDRIRSFEELADAIREAGESKNVNRILEDLLPTVSIDAYSLADHPAIVDELRKHGYDAMIHKDVFDAGMPYYQGKPENVKEGFTSSHVIDAYRPFEQSKIKSAIGNRGTYDIKDPDITKAKGGVVHMDKGGSVGAQTNPFFDLANIDLSAGPPRDAMYSGFVPGANPMARKAEQQRLMRESKQLTPAAALMRGLGEGYFGDITTPNAEQGYSVMDPSNRAPEGREAEMQRYRDLGTALGIVADPATMLAPFAKPAAKAVGRGALAAAKSDTAYDLANRVASATGSNPFYAVKPKGGNWAPSLSGQDTVTRALQPLKKQPGELTGPLSQEDEALNLWLDKKLASYVRNEMGTPDDPIRIAHEQGYSHSPAIRGMEENAVGAWLPQRTADLRHAAGFPDEGFANLKHAEAGYPQENLLNTRKAEEWETLSDAEIEFNRASNYQEDLQTARKILPNLKSTLYENTVKLAEKNPWIEKLSPETPLYRIRGPQQFASGLDFNHLMDELRASMSPNSELPAHLRLTPDKLNKVSVADAVKRVSEINDWRAIEAAKAEQAGMMENLATNTRLADPTAQLSFVEKPGLTWVDVPAVVDAKGTKLCTDIGKAGGWCTMNADTAKEYGSGNNRLVALLDAEGRPHAQAMIVKSKKRPYDIWYEQNPHRSPENNAFMDWLEAKRVETGDKKMNTGQNYIEWAKETGRTIPTQAVPDIAELKPPGNAFSSDRSNVYKKRDPDYQNKVSESVVKFLNSGQWGTVDDLYHYGIFDLSDPSSYEGLVRLFGEDGADKVFAATRANGGTPPVRFMTRNQLKDFIEQPEIVYHAGAEFNDPRPGLFTHPEREVVEKFKSSTNAPQLHTFEARPRRSGTEEDVYRVARQLGIYDPELPVGQYLEQGENAIFPQSAQVVEELRNLGFDSLRLQDAMGKKPSLVALDPSVLRRVPPAEGYAEGGAVKSDFFIDPSSYAQSRSKQMFPKQKSEWTQQDAARHMLASGMMAQKFGPAVAKVAGLAHEHGNAPVKTIGYMLGIGKMPPDYDQDLHNNALGVQIGKEAKSQEDLESRIQAILNSATKQPTPGQPWIGRPNIPNQISDYAKGGKVSTNPFDHLV